MFSHRALLDGQCPALFHTLQTLPRLVIKACISEPGRDGRRRKMCLLSSLPSKRWCHHQTCLAPASFLSISQTSSTLIRHIHTHVHKLFTSVPGPLTSHPVCLSEFIREPAFRCDKPLIMHLSHTDKTCLYRSKTEVSLIGQTFV